MGILSRFGDIISSNINDLLDKCENPEKMARQYLRQAMEDLADVKKETAGIMAEERRCKDLYEKAAAKVSEYDIASRNALKSGEEDAARKLLTKKAELQAQADAANTTYQAAAANAKKMREMYTKLSGDVSTLQTRLKNVEAMTAVAGAQKTVNKFASKDAGQALSKFDRMEEKAKAALYAAEAEAELSETPVDEASELAAKYGAPGGGDVDDELAKLKAEMGLE